MNCCCFLAIWKAGVLWNQNVSFLMLTLASIWPWSLHWHIAWPAGVDLLWVFPQNSAWNIVISTGGYNHSLLHDSTIPSSLAWTSPIAYHPLLTNLTGQRMQTWYIPEGRLHTDITCMLHPIHQGRTWKIWEDLWMVQFQLILTAGGLNHGAHSVGLQWPKMDRVPRIS